MKKRKIFIDYDGTLVNSIEPICGIYNELYCSDPSFVVADPDKVTTWNMKEQLPLCADINDLFSHYLFFEFAKPLDEHTVPVLEQLAKDNELIVCTIGVPENISKKAKYIQKQFPMIKQSVLLMQDNCKMDKSIVNMGEPGTIFLDDVAANLFSSNADLKICVGKKFEWNKNWTGMRAKTWKDVGNSLL